MDKVWIEVTGRSGVFQATVVSEKGGIRRFDLDGGPLLVEGVDAAEVPAPEAMDLVGTVQAKSVTVLGNVGTINMDDL